MLTLSALVGIIYSKEQGYVGIWVRVLDDYIEVVGSGDPEVDYFTAIGIAFDKGLVPINTKSVNMLFSGLEGFKPI